MAPEPTGQITTTTLTDGTKAFQLRFRNKGRRERVTLHERRNCRCGCGGGWNERAAAVQLDNILAKVRAGVWRKRAVTPPPSAGRMPTFHEYASTWLVRIRFRQVAALRCADGSARLPAVDHGVPRPFCIGGRVPGVPGGVSLAGGVRVSGLRRASGVGA